MSDKQSTGNNELVARSNAFLNHKVNLLDEKQLAAASVFMKNLVANEKGGIKSVQEGIAVLARAQDLNLPFMSSIEHIHVINGKTGIDVHLCRALLSRAGVTWKKVKDYTPQYQYTDGSNVYNETSLPSWCKIVPSPNKALEISNDEQVGVYPLRFYADLKGNVYNEFQVSDKCKKCINRAQALQVAKNGEYPVIRVNPQPIDYVTEYEFHRMRKQPDGTFKEQVVNSHFSFIDAQNAGFFDKDTYKKYPRIMVETRAFTLGAREVGDDLLMGCYEMTELGLVENVDIDEATFEEVN